MRTKALALRSLLRTAGQIGGIDQWQCPNVEDRQPPISLGTRADCPDVDDSASRTGRSLSDRDQLGIDALIAKAEEHIALAKERRSALITAAVTGQIDVRTARKAS